MAGIVRAVCIAAFCGVFNFPVLAIMLPNTTYIPDTFDKSSLKAIVENLGLIYMSFQVVTPDGYILNLNRVVNPGVAYYASHGIPVLLVHGMTMHGDSWFLETKPEDNVPIAFLLAGYDVWIGDQRGSIRSRNHVTLKESDRRFWDFSFHETGVYDLPTFIDFILASTGHPKLAYAGLSDGGAFYYVMCSERPEYQAKLYGGILFTPVGESPSLFTLPWAAMLGLLSAEQLLSIGWSVGLGEFPPSNHLFRTGACMLCRLGPQLALKITAAVFGPGCQFEDNICLKLTGTALGGTSARTVIHTIQLFTNGGAFRKYDYGLRGNLVKYGQPSPPVYDIRKLRVFTALYYSDTDILAPSRTVVPFSKKFSGPTYTCEFKGVCHGFIMADARAAPYVRDSVEVLHSMTGRKGPAKMYSKTCRLST